jgi:hypothetical protein
MENKLKYAIFNIEFDFGDGLHETIECKILAKTIGEGVKRFTRIMDGYEERANGEYTNFITTKKEYHNG